MNDDIKNKIEYFKDIFKDKPEYSNAEIKEETTKINKMLYYVVIILLVMVGAMMVSVGSMIMDVFISKNKLTQPPIQTQPIIYQIDCNQNESSNQ